jgi:hypothetical protein
MSKHTAENDAPAVSLDQHRVDRVPTPAPGEPAITFGMDDDRITFRDQDALDEYVRGAIAEFDSLAPIVRAAVVDWNTRKGEPGDDVSAFIARALVGARVRVAPPASTGGDA